MVEGHDVAARGEGPEVRRDEGRPEHDLGRHLAGGVVGALGQHGHGEAERAGRLARHAGQLTRPDEPDVVRAQVARPRPGIRLDSGADTTGRLREEHQGHGQAAAHREHDRRRQAAARHRGPAAAVPARPGSTTPSPSQIFGPDALTLLAAAGSQVPGIGLGTGVVPVYPRHPMMLAQQALTVQAATGNRLLLGIGLSHQVVVEGMWGMSFEQAGRAT